MNDLIYRRAAIDIVRHECGEWEGLAKEIVKQFNGLPPVDADPVRRGKWIIVTDDHHMSWRKCSECGTAFDLAVAWRFCPHCGADMKEEGKTNE